MKKENTIKIPKCRISPKGVITLPACVRKELDISTQKGKVLGVSIKEDQVKLYSSFKEDKPRLRVSKKGLLQLNSKARKALKKKKNKNRQDYFQVKFEQGSGKILLKN